MTLNFGDNKWSLTCLFSNDTATAKFSKFCTRRSCEDCLDKFLPDDEYYDQGFNKALDETSNEINGTSGTMIILIKEESCV